MEVKISKKFKKGEWLGDILVGGGHAEFQMGFEGATGPLTPQRRFRGLQVRGDFEGFRRDSGYNVRYTVFRAILGGS